MSRLAHPADTRCSPVPQNRSTALRRAAALLAAPAILAAAAGCRFTAAEPQAFLQSLEQQEQNRGPAIHMRWFPVDEAVAYRITGENEQGDILFEEAVKPSGCTQRLKDGFTSGVCTLLYRPPETDKQYRLRISAVGAAGESGQPSVPLKPRLQ